ncbi:hypothetical protein BUALT_Bualt11G0002800 [Buddleja alternifolia]|uniref:GRF-type domain-containing protein n=1 Tax=Buddleja alternifolia TaxID=168488 RepID=A0AAV6WYC0_9LAMI|nr:hypothetical protein BUALT_Bualt11G0002800 [Buddleja alternifolia]
MSEVNSNITCYCGLRAQIRTSWTNENPGRRFHACADVVSSGDPVLGSGEYGSSMVEGMVIPFSAVVSSEYGSSMVEGMVIPFSAVI